MEGPEIPTEEQEAPERKGPGAIAIGFWLALTGAILLRFRFLGDALQPDRIELFGADPWYHLRRATQIYERFPDLAYHDPFHTFPHGEACSALPAGFGILLNMCAWIFPGETIGERIAIGGLFLVPLLGLLTLWILARISRQVLRPLPALAAIVAMALLPAAVDCCFAGRMDHHVLDPLVAVAIFYCLWRSIEATGEGRESLCWALGAGVVGFLGLMSFPSALVTVGLILGGGILAVLLGAIRGIDTQRTAWAIGIAGLVAGVLHAQFLLIATPCFGSTTLVANSLIPVALVSGCGILSFLLFVALPSTLDSAARKQRGLALVVGITLTTIVLLLIPNPLQAAISGWLDVMAGDLLPQLSEEWRPLADTPIHWLNGKLSWAFVLVPVGVVVMGLRAWRMDASAGDRLMASILFGLSALLVLQLKYFIYLAAPFLCIAMAAPMDAAWPRIQAFATTALRKAGLGVVALSLFGFLSYQPYTHYKEMELNKWQTRETLDLLEWVRDNTPPVDPDNPEYGILNTWHTGFWIPAVAERPNFANNFVAAPTESVYIQHLKTAYDWLLVEDPTALYEGMEEHRLEYLLLAPINGKAVRGYLALSKRESENIVTFHEESEQWIPTGAFNNTLLARLLLVQGRTIPDLPCVERLQLLKSTPGKMSLAGREVPVAQFYKLVKGALIEGQAPPGSPIRIGTGRFVLADDPNAPFRFSFECSTTAREDGTFSLRFPYPNVRVGDVVPASPILLWRGERHPDNPPEVLEISEDDVESGHTVFVP